jgi:hypothetical protein
MKAIQIISQDLFDKVRSRFQNLEMGDETGAVTIDPRESRFFDFDFVIEGNNLGRVSISLNDLGSLKVYYSQGITENQDSFAKKEWYNFLKEMRYFAMRRLLRFDTRDIAKTNLDKNDFQHLAATQGPEEEDMTTMNESRWDGKNSKKTSRAVAGRTEVIVRHAKPVEETYPGARSQRKNIKAIFIQNADGERYKYPFIHPAGAFAMAQHVDHGGIPHDPAGKAIIKMSEQIAQLQEFQRKIQRTSLHDDAMGITERAVGRLNELKAKVASLGKRHHYEGWMTEFNSQPTLDDDIMELDAVTMEDYKSKFTQRSFEEDLTRFFPLLHNIMKEANKIELADYVSEAEWDHDPFRIEKPSDYPTDDENKAALKNAVIKMWNAGKDIFEIAQELECDDEVVKDIVDAYENDGEYDSYRNDDSAYAMDHPDHPDYYGDMDESPEGQFEEWADSMEQGKLTSDQIKTLKQELEKLPQTQEGPELELGPDGQTAWQFFNELGINDDGLKYKLSAAAEVDDSTNAVQIFSLWAQEEYPELAVALGVSGTSEEPTASEQPAAEMTHPGRGGPGLSTVHGIMASENDEATMGKGMMPKESRDPKDMIKEVAKIVKSFYNKDNPDVGPFRGHEGIVIDVQKSISEKFGDEAGEQAAELAEKFMSKLTTEWQHLHGKTEPVDDTDGLARLKELLGNVKQQVEGLGNDDTMESETDEGFKNSKFSILGVVASLAGLWGVSTYEAKQAYDHDPQLQKLMYYYKQAQEQHNEVKMKELEHRIEMQKDRLSLGFGPVLDKHGNPKEVVPEMADILKLAGLNKI